MNYLDAKGWLTRPEREFLKMWAGVFPEDATFLNVGIEYGASLHCIKAGNPEADLHAIDLVGEDKLVGDISAYFYKRDSAEVAKHWGLPIHFAFIDGDHSYDGVMRDIKFLDHVVIGGVVGFHDCYSWEEPGKPHKICPEVNHAVSNWFGDYGEGWEELEAVDSIRVFRRTR